VEHGVKKSTVCSSLFDKGTRHFGDLMYLPTYMYSLREARLLGMCRSLLCRGSLVGTTPSPVRRSLSTFPFGNKSSGLPRSVVICTRSKLDCKYCTVRRGKLWRIYEGGAP